jgi:hypothetical protein
MKYYFLVSYLPDIHRDDKKLKIRLAELLSEKYLFTDKDLAEIDLLLLQGDLLQIEQILSGKDREVEYSLYGKEFWKEQLKSHKEIPEFLQEALDLLSSEGLTAKGLDRLHDAYFSYAIEATSSPLLKTFLSFQRDLRNVLVAVRARRKGLPPSEYLVGEGDVVDILSRSSSEDFGLGQHYPWMDRLLAAKEPSQIDEAVQAIVWETLDEMTQHLDFEFDVVLAYLLKLQILERNIAMSEDKGMEVVRQMEEL